MNITTTTDLSKFGWRERNMAEALLHAWNENELPEDFSDNEVTIMMNANSGNVFLTNSEFEVAMMNGDTLESFYSTPYEGLEGFYDELMEQYDDMNDEDKEFMDNLKQYHQD